MRLPLTGWLACLWPERFGKWVQMDGKVPLSQILLCPQTSWSLELLLIHLMKEKI